MKRKWITQLLVALFILGVALTACTGEGQSPEGYPGANEGGYPASQADLPQPTPIPDVLYPGLADGDNVSWIQAVGMINNGEVVEVFQTHDLKITLTLKDGRTLHSIEPEIDMIFRIIENCGDPCKDIAVATE